MQEEGWKWLDEKQKASARDPIGRDRRACGALTGREETLADGAGD